MWSDDKQGTIKSQNKHLSSVSKSGPSFIDNAKMHFADNDF